MLYPGILAAPALLAPPGAIPNGPVPSGAKSYLDFIDRYYYAGGAFVTLTGALTGTDAAAIEARGLVDNGLLSTYPIASAALLSDLSGEFSAGLSIVCEVDCDTRPNGAFIGLFDDADPSAAANWIVVEPDFTTQAIQMFDSDTLSLSGGHADQLASGVQKYGFTIGRDLGGGSFEYVGCVNGGTPFSTTLGYGLSFISLVAATIFNIDAWGVHDSNGAWLRTLSLYPAMNQADLQTATA